MDYYKIIVFVIAGVLAGWLWGYIQSLFKVRKYKKEIKDLNGHLNRQIKIIDEGSKGLEKELVKLKKKNENLLETISTYKQKPGRTELRILNIYDIALRKIKLINPGFYSAWEATLQDAENEFEANERGEKAINKRVLNPISSTTQLEKENPSR
jgi:hypothetical protein